MCPFSSNDRLPAQEYQQGLELMLAGEDAWDIRSHGAC
jgi:hypothetical protein